MRSSIYILLLLLIVTSVSAMEVSRFGPYAVDPGTIITMRIDMKDISYIEGKEIGIMDNIPEGMKLLEWDIQKATNISTESRDSKTAWAFIPTSDSATLIYKLQVPNENKDYTFGPIVWFDKSGFSKNVSGIHKLSVSAPGAANQDVYEELKTLLANTTEVIAEEKMPKIILNTTKINVTVDEEPTTKLNDKWIALILIAAVGLIVGFLIWWNNGKKQ